MDNKTRTAKLRSELIKLAHANPGNIREKILPVLAADKAAVNVRKTDPFGSDPEVTSREKLPRYMAEVGKQARVLAQAIKAAETVAKTAGVTDPFFAKAAKTAEDISTDAAKVDLTSKK